MTETGRSGPWLRFEFQVLNLIRPRRRDLSSSAFEFGFRVLIRHSSFGFNSVVRRIDPYKSGGDADVLVGAGEGAGVITGRRGQRRGGADHPDFAEKAAAEALGGNDGGGRQQ